MFYAFDGTTVYMIYVHVIKTFTQSCFPAHLRGVYVLKGFTSSCNVLKTQNRTSNVTVQNKQYLNKQELLLTQR